MMAAVAQRCTVIAPVLPFAHCRHTAALRQLPARNGMTSASGIARLLHVATYKQIRGPSTAYAMQAYLTKIKSTSGEGVATI